MHRDYNNVESILSALFLAAFTVKHCNDQMDYLCTYLSQVMKNESMMLPITISEKQRICDLNK